ncbi:MAG: ABC transporter permease [Rothia sp. (in: high G+C Gram-positive bacteria)]|uniref:ABC transporter permease n=1 Tax=Rothia sp. (in: high G+C Gram-positive bacteria) TaxID=1885016 RepID=UPI0026DF056E|nr:ABC transporter permease [Rothia sp. (in: high G+C Gram-positive bacteria)]MDO5750522.1 ABC transporter permease [Rothia sp. (in: high G+C Gram-positive bacteria)]
MSQATETTALPVVQGDDFKVISKSSIIVRRFLRNKAAVFGLAVFLLMILFGFFGQYLTSYKPTDIDFMALGEEPSAEHWFGTTSAGNDLYAQMVEAVRVSLLIGILVGTVSILVSAIYGCVMAYFGGWVDKVMLFILETLIMVPSLLILAILINGEIGKEIQKTMPAWMLLSIVLIFFGWMGPARLIRAVAQSLITRDYVKAARYMGVHPFKIVWRHLVPNLGSLLVLDFTRGIMGAVLSEVAYSFIGIGVKYPNYSLGSMIQAASEQINTLPHMFWFPVFFFFLLVGPLALMNDGLRDAFDPTSMSVGSIKKSKKKDEDKKSDSKEEKQLAAAGAKEAKN